MAKRSPILGYNHNVRYRGLIFHVQTEDSGLLSPHLFTHLFHSGVIISTRKLVYDAGAAEDAVKGLMQAQHKVVMKDLRRGAFDDKIDVYLAGTPGLLPRGAGGEGADASGPHMAASVSAEMAAVTPSESRAPDVAAVAAIASDNATVRTPMPAGDSGAEVQLEIVPASEHSEVIHLTTPRQTHNQGGLAPSDGVPGRVGPASADDRLGQYAQHRPRPDSAGARLPGIATGRPPASPAASAPTPRGSSQIPAASHAAPVGPRPTDLASRPTERPRTPTPARVSTSSAVQSRGASGSNSGVVMSRPAVIVGAPATPAAPPRVRRAREDEGRGFGHGLISEKSLDEVILAYLSEDAEES